MPRSSAVTDLSLNASSVQVRAVKAIFLALALAMPAGAEAQARPPFCRALDALVRVAVRTRQAQRPFVAQAEPFSFACGHRSRSRVQRAFCSAARDAVGLEFLHTFPWKVYDCLKASSVEPEIRTTDHYTGLIGRARIVRLAARSPAGATIEIRYTPFEDDGEPDERFVGLRGRYDVTVAKAD